MYQQQLPQLQANISKVMFADFPTMHFPNPGAVQIFEEDFTNFRSTITNANPPTVPGYSTAQVAGGPGGIVLTDGLGGEIELDSEGVAQHDGVQMQKDSESFLPQAGYPIWFEARFTVVSDAATCQIFIGLAETGAGVANQNTVLPLGVMDHANIQYIGFAVETGWGTGMQFVSAATNLLEIDIPTLTLVNTTWFRVAFYMCPTGEVYQFVNDIAITPATPIPFAYVPTVLLRPTITCQADAAADPILWVDYMRVVKLRNR